ncbi:MAG: response regulator [Maribacter sp.]|uniref:response regulator n=1 Tax=Maribacter sp. TaxID=1897614 RepID=UPI0032968EAE
MSLSLNSILLVDDDEISHLFNKIFIGKLNLNVDLDFALNGKEALHLLAPANGSSTILLPCLVLLDVNMPVMGGWEFLKAYVEEVHPDTRKKVTIVMLTTSADEADMIKVMNNPHVKEYVKKPLSEEAIRQLIGKYFPNTKIDN